MRSTEVYKIINPIIQPTLKTMGFRKITGGMLGYYKKLKQYYLVFWFQCCPRGFETYLVSQFTVEFQIGESNIAGTRSIAGHRLGGYLTDDERKEITNMENVIREKMKKPPMDYDIYQMDAASIRLYMSLFEKLERNYALADDIWFKYLNAEDVTAWTEYLFPKILRTIEELEKNEY